MNDQVTTSYATLFEVRLLHHYWLNDGPTAFDDMAQDIRNNRLLTYDSRKIFSIQPTTATASILKGFRCVFKPTTLGFLVGTPANKSISNDVVMDFIVTVVDPNYYSYTSLPFPSAVIHAKQHASDARTFRFKENVPLLSNLSGVKRGTNPTHEIFLSVEYVAAQPNAVVESLVKKTNALHQLLSDGQNAATQQIHAQVANAPVFLHQGDLHDVAIPAGVIMNSLKGIQLEEDTPDNIELLIRIGMFKAVNSDFNCNITADPDLRPVFQVRFKNRSTFWRYIDKRTKVINATENAPLPLTFSGNAGTKQKPNTGFVRKIKLTNAPNAPENLVSEIYV